jgi:Transposase DDE domain group 1
LDPLLALLTGKREPAKEPLASKSTLNRLELTRPLAAVQAQRYQPILFDPASADQLWLPLFVEAHRRPPPEFVLAFDATDDPLPGKQEGRCFHGYYGHYCYVPLYVFCGDPLRCARLRTAAGDAERRSARRSPTNCGAPLRQHWPGVRITRRADSGFCRAELMRWGEDHQVDYVFGLARNRRLAALLAEALAEARQQQQSTGPPVRLFRELCYQTRESWSRERRVVGKAEHLDKGANPRFVVPSLSAEQGAARALYEDLDCAHGERENRVKEQFQLFADRLSTHWLWSNQLRLYLTALVLDCVCLRAGRQLTPRLALSSTTLAQAEVNTIRLRRLKIRGDRKGPRAAPLGVIVPCPSRRTGVRASLASAALRSAKPVAPDSDGPFFDNQSKTRA